MHRGKICKPSETLDQGIRRFDRWTIFWPISSASQALQSPPTPEFPIINMHSSWLDKTVGKQDIWGLLSFENLSDFYAKKQSSIPLLQHTNHGRGWPDWPYRPDGLSGSFVYNDSMLPLLPMFYSEPTILESILLNDYIPHELSMD